MEEGRLSRIQVVLTEEELKEIDSLFGEYIVESESRDIVLLNKSGELLAKSGDITSDVAVTVSALAAGVFSATNELARILGEREFTVTFHQGQETNIHVSLVTDTVLLAMIFDNRSPIGAIRFWAKKIGSSVKDIIAKAEERAKNEKPPEKISDSNINEDIENLF
jgi:predicted regulator of Ras-like GTPase activity (Roadblock/LC7/MglB family)